VHVETLETLAGLLDLDPHMVATIVRNCGRTMNLEITW
jgi:hypothetical protein